jgi:hypothetical protein
MLLFWVHVHLFRKSHSTHTPAWDPLFFPSHAQNANRKLADREANERMDADGLGDPADSLWVDKYAPKCYADLLSDEVKARKPLIQEIRGNCI